jgi:cysteine desulfurase / selenocysteine lyase
VDDNTRIVLVSHVQSRSGYRTDLRELARRCRQAGVYLVVDAIQSLGFCPVDAAAWGVDAVVSACYKGLLASGGIGLIYCHEQLLEQVWPVYLADNACMSIENQDNRWAISCSDAKDARKLENSTLNFGGIYALNAGLRRLLAVGIDNIYSHISGLVDLLHEGLTELGYDIATPADKGQRCHSIAVRMSDAKTGFEYFQSRGVFVSLSAGRFVRMSVAPFNTQEDIKKALAVAAEMTAEVCRRATQVAAPHPSPPYRRCPLESRLAPP